MRALQTSKLYFYTQNPHIKTWSDWNGLEEGKKNFEFGRKDLRVWQGSMHLVSVRWGGIWVAFFVGRKTERRSRWHNRISTLLGRSRVSRSRWRWIRDSKRRRSRLSFGMRGPEGFTLLVTYCSVFVRWGGYWRGKSKRGTNFNNKCPYDLFGCWFVNEHMFDFFSRENRCHVESI